MFGYPMGGGSGGSSHWIVFPAGVLPLNGTYDHQGFYISSPKSIKQSKVHRRLCRVESLHIQDEFVWCRHIPITSHLPKEKATLGLFGLFKWYLKSLKISNIPIFVVSKLGGGLYPVLPSAYFHRIFHVLHSSPMPLIQGWRICRRCFWGMSRNSLMTSCWATQLQNAADMGTGREV